MKLDLADLKKKILNAPKIVLHRFSHLDDAATLWFLENVIQLKTCFELQYNNDLHIKGELGEIGLDVMHEYAVKGYKLADGGYSSAFRCVVEAFEEELGPNRFRAIQPIVAWVDGDDSTGSATKAILGEEHALLEMVGLTTLFKSHKALYEDDFSINRAFGKNILDVLFHHLSKMEELKEKVRQNCRFDLQGVVGICEGVVPREVMEYPAEHLKSLAKKTDQAKPRVLFYKDPSVGVGMVRLDSKIRLDQEELVEFIRQTEDGKDWFVHPGGFLTACGTTTSPKNTDQLKLNTQELFHLLNRIFGV
jgi:hypothetical protein